MNKNDLKIVSREFSNHFLRVFHVRFLVLSAKIEKLRKFYINPIIFILFGQEIISNHGDPATSGIFFPPLSADVREPSLTHRSSLVVELKIDT